ncbi:unnamed protein product, partial [Allacma fusca]
VRKMPELAKTVIFIYVSMNTG